MPQIIPIKDLKDTSSVSRICKEAREPVFITKNGYGELVLMSIECYQEMFAKQAIANMVNESVAEIENGAAFVDGSKYFEDMRAKYAK